MQRDLKNLDAGRDNRLKVFKAHDKDASPTGPLTAGPVLVLAADPVPLTFQIEHLRKQGRDVAVCSDMGQFQNLLGLPIEHWSMLIIEIEGFGGITAVISPRSAMVHFSKNLATASARVWTPSFSKILFMCV